MSKPQHSLLGGRNQAPLSPHEIRRASTTFLGLDKKVNTRYEQGSRTVFRVSVDDSGQQFGEIVFGPDIYPGSSVVDPNSALSLDAAAAHELAHFHRWKDKIALAAPTLENLDEAMTSLQAIQRYNSHLNESDVQQLVADAIQRINLFVREQAESGQAHVAGAVGNSCHAALDGKNDASLPLIAGEAPTDQAEG
jgi:hypothetical protein